MLVNGPSDSCPALGSAPRLILLDRKNCSKTNYHSASYRLLHRGISKGPALRPLGRPKTLRLRGHGTPPISECL